MCDLMTNMCNRLYNSSSVEIFTLVSHDLKQWVEQQPSKTSAMSTLRKFRESDGLFPLLGNAIFNFIKRKPGPLRKLCTSKMSFREVPAWRRALTCLFMIRWLTDKPGNRQWKNFSEKDYKTNVRIFRRYMQKDERIMELCEDIRGLPDTDEAHDRRQRKRDLKRADSMSEPPVNKYKVDNSSSEDEDGDGDDETIHI